MVPAGLPVSNLEVNACAPSRRSAASVSIRGKRFSKWMGHHGRLVHAPGQQIEVPVIGAGTAWSDGEHSQFQSLPDPRHRPQVQANGSIVIDQNTCPRSTGFGSFESNLNRRSPLILFARGQGSPSFRSAAHNIKSVIWRREVRNSCPNSDTGTKPVGFKTLVAVNCG